MKNEINNSFDKKPSSLKRIASLDFARGFAIYLMTFFHCFYHVYDQTWFQEDPSKILEFPKIVLVILAILVFLGTWASFFLLVSSTVNTLAMVRSTKRRLNPNQVLFKNILTAVGLLVADHLIEGWGWYGFIGEGLRSGIWDTAEIWHSFFRIHILQMIAWSLIITSLINYFLLRNKGFEKYKRNMIIYGILTAIIIISSPFVHNFVDSSIAGWPLNETVLANPSLKTWILVILAGNAEPVFPILATGFVGAMIGLTVSRTKQSKKFLLWGTIVAVILILIGGLLFLAGLPFNLYDRPLIHIYLIQLGGEIGILMLCFGLIEFRGRGEKFANRRIVRVFRKWSMVALTIYALEIYDLIPKWSLNLMLRNVTGINFLGKTLSFEGTHWALLIAIYCMLWYHLLVWFWGKINFKFAFEWFMLRVQSIATKMISERLDVDLMMNKVIWMDFVERNQEITANLS
ncbi:MAG: hypothetical protein ACFFDS_08710 [Candidatus Thorarchaeota archaeon]